MGNRCNFIIYICNNLPNALDFSDSFSSNFLHLLDLRCYFFRCPCCLIGKIFNFICNDSESLTCFTRPCRFDGGI